jgi:hypothetical protein
MRHYLLLLLLFVQPALANDCIVLLHGLGRTSHSMSALEKHLKQDGYVVVNHSYPSTKANIDQLSSVVGKGIEECRSHKVVAINFVTHSLGGILVRDYFQSNVVPEARRVVMLGPPNHGSEVTTRNKNKWWYKLFTGPAGQELGVEPTSKPNQLAKIPLEVGIIAGAKSLDPWFSSDIKGQNDGKVSVESAKIEGMKDFIKVPHSHTFMAESSDVCKQVSYFLSQGKFKHEI